MNRREFLGALSLGLAGLALTASGIGGLLEGMTEPPVHEGMQHANIDDIRRYTDFDVEAELCAIMEEKIHKDIEKEFMEAFRQAEYSMI